MINKPLLTYCAQARRLILTLTLMAALPWAAAAHANSAYVLSIRGAISPASADYLLRGLDKAIAAQAQLVVIELDTPGGLDSAMRSIIKAILASPIPVVTYVWPQGARAASAGTFILYASHVAAMAPATNLGAATPVGLMPQPPTTPARTPVPSGASEQPSDTPEPLGAYNVKTRKAMNDAASYIRGLAELRGRNADWAEAAVRDAASLSADAALNAKVIDLVASDITDLLKQLDGRAISINNRVQVLATSDLSLIRAEPDWRSELLAVISDPNFAYALLLIGIYGLLFEFYNPGMFVPGVIGGISLLLAAFALQLMPISYAGLALILLGIGFMVAEGFAPSFGILGLGGATAFVFGSVMLIDTDSQSYGISWALIAPLAVTCAFLSFAIGYLALRARNRPVVTGAEEVTGSEGLAIENIQEQGWARIHGEMWRVRAKAPIQRGQRLRVIARKGMTLDVEPINPTIKETDHA